jgi:hypothetical protein
MKPEKWTIEWAMKRWGIEISDNHNPVFGKVYSLKDKEIYFLSGQEKWTAFGELTVFKSERAAVRWLVEGQPRVGKKKKWALESKEIYKGKMADTVRFGIVGGDPEVKTSIVRKGDTLTAKTYKRSK